MNWGFIGAGCIMLLIAGFVGADPISSTIVCDGATWVSSSVLGQGQIYAASLFTTNFAYLIRNLTVNNAGQVKTGTVVDSTGPLGVDEYSGQITNHSSEEKRCLLIHPVNQIRYMGLMTAGVYSSTRTLSRSETSSSTMVNGSGMVLSRAKTADGENETTHGSDVAGHLNMTEQIIFGDER